LRPLAVARTGAVVMEDPQSDDAPDDDDADMTASEPVLGLGSFGVTGCGGAVVTVGPGCPGERVATEPWRRCGGHGGLSSPAGESM